MGKSYRARFHTTTAKLTLWFCYESKIENAEIERCFRQRLFSSDKRSYFLTRKKFDSAVKSTEILKDLTNNDESLFELVSYAGMEHRLGYNYKRKNYSTFCQLEFFLKLS